MTSAMTRVDVTGWPHGIRCADARGETASIYAHRVTSPSEPMMLYLALWLSSISTPSVTMILYLAVWFSTIPTPSETMMFYLARGEFQPTDKRKRALSQLESSNATSTALTAMNVARRRICGVPKTRRIWLDRSAPIRCYLLLSTCLLVAPHRAS